MSPDILRVSMIDGCNLCLNSPIIFSPNHIVYASISHRILQKKKKILIKNSIERLIKFKKNNYINSCHI